VAALIDGAIRSFNEDDHVCAITLAGAAETAIPAGSELKLFAMMRDAGAPYFEGTDLRTLRGKAADALNLTRNWLKHYHPAMSGEIEIENSIMYIIRALHAFDAAYGATSRTKTMMEFTQAAREFDPDD
jgi:hypothetical protein